MRLDDFRALVARMERDIPPEFEGGVVGVEVSPKTVPDPVLAAVAIALQGRRGSGVGGRSGGTGAPDDAHDPFGALGGWRLGG